LPDFKQHFGCKIPETDVLDEYRVISTKEKVEDGSKWLTGEARMAYQERIDALTDLKTRFEIYESP
jgi:hypothetical protein